MAKSKPSVQKREREKLRAQKKLEKDERRAEAQARKARGERREGDEDPDIAGIVPGPQPLPSAFWDHVDERKDD